MSLNTAEHSENSPNPLGRTGLYLRNTLANGIGYGARLTVAFFLSPFVVHQLGDTVYGAWVLLVSLTGYMGLLDIGVTTSISRFINLYVAKNEQKRLNSVVSTALAMCLFAGLILTVVAIILGSIIDNLFPRIPAELTDQARAILIILSGNIVLGFVACIFRQLLAARDRFDLINIVTLATLLCNALGTVAALKIGWGILGLALVQLVSSAIAGTMVFWLAQRYGTAFEIGLMGISRATTREIIHFGVFAFVADVGIQLIYYTGSMVIGALIGAAAITFYNIPFMLVDYGRTAIKQVQAVLAPELLKVGGRSEGGEMQWLAWKTTRFQMLFAIPLMLGIIFFGSDFIRLWMGPKYAEQYFILVVLALSELAVTTASPFATFLLGIGRVRLLAGCVVAEGLTNLVLSVILVRFFNLGILGVALGTFFPALVLSSFLVPILACKSAGMSFQQHAHTTVLRVLPACLLIAIPFLLFPGLSAFSNWASFVGKGVLFVILCASIGCVILITKEERSQL